ncbi:MAG TPA: glycosyltransferase [Candidatus Limnocylindria bacterium]|jgi:rhamnosyl/mannosyltransferase|nr:glycosyltransferase [Candidatus Limnocylindria bacterium]
MNILELGKFYPPERGGIETLLPLWSEGFINHGAKVTCIVANRAFKTKVENVNGVDVHRLASLGQAFSTSLCPTYPLATRLHQADIIHAHFPNPLADLACILAPKHVPVVISWHSDIVRQRALMRFYAPIQNAMLRRANAVVVATPNHLKYSDWLGPFADKVKVIPFGLNLDRFKATPALLQRAAELRQISKRPHVLINIGRLVGYKGQRYAIEALRHLDAELWIMGLGPAEAELKALAASVGVADRVRWLGDISQNLLPAYLHAADVFVFPSNTPNEAFGLVLVEAMACGKPLVACDLPSGVPYVCRNGVNGLIVPPDDANALALALQELLSNGPLRRQLGEKGRSLSAEEYSAPVMVDRYWQLFRNLRAAVGNP